MKQANLHGNQRESSHGFQWKLDWSCNDKEVDAFHCVKKIP